MKTQERSNSHTGRESLAKHNIVRAGLLIILALLMATSQGGQMTAEAASAAGGGQAPEESKLALPKEFGEPGSVSAAPAFGAVSDQLELTVPPGRRNVQPKLMLRYNSMSGLGTLGLGWSLETGYVEMWRGDGLPNVGNTDSFIYSLAGAGGQLINTGDGVYRARLESVYREFRHSEVHGGWEMYNGEGALHRFGGTPDSRIDDKQWMLDLVQDPMGNTITYSYIRQGNTLYISEIRYTGYAPEGDLGANLVQFEYDTRPDTRVDLGLSVRQEKTWRLKSVSMYAGNQLARRYEFTYVLSQVNGLSLLDQVTLVGADGLSRITLRDLEYGTRSLGWGAGVQYSWPAALADPDGLDTGTRIVDVNGDGFADLIKNDGWVYFGLGDDTFNSQYDPDWSASLQATDSDFKFVNPEGDNKGLEKGVRLLDVNSDGLPDVFIAQDDQREIYLNTGHGWSYDAGWSTSLDSIRSQAIFTEGSTPFALVGLGGEPKGVQMADVNADGRVDIIWSFRRTADFLDWVCSWFEPECYGATQVRGIFLNTGTGWQSNQTLTQALASVDFFIVDAEWRGYDLVDVNGDGLADIVRTLGGQSLEVRLGTGSGWELDTSFSDSLSANNLIALSDDKTQGLIPLDFNDDGLMDYIKANGNSRNAYTNTGTGWVGSPQITEQLNSLEIAFATSDGKGTGTQPIDMNGDGVVDIVQSKGDSTYIFSGSGLRSGLLRQVTSPLGEVTQITWAVSTQFDNHTADGAESLPAAIPVVTGIIRQDGRVSPYQVTYSYSGGLYTGRQFRGFHQVEQRLPSGLNTIFHYHQEEGLVGLAESVESLDSSNAVRLEQKSVYAQVDTGLGVFQTYLAQSEALAFDPGGAQHSKTENQVDDHLNFTSIRRDPDANLAGDETIVKYEWALNEGAGIWSLVSKAQVLSLDGIVLQEKITYFDGLPEKQAAKGLPTTVQDLVEPGRYASGSLEYDKYGNVVKIIDRENNASTFTYDGATATFRVGAVDAEGRVSESQYDPRFGLPIEETDAAGRTSRTEYDAFGRATKVILPGDEASPFGTQTITYSEVGDATAQYYVVAETETAGEPGTLDTTYFFDGMGRIYRAEREADGGRKVVTLAEYDDAGNANLTTRPFFDGDPQVWTVVERDELYRPVRVTDQDGSQVSMDYAGPLVDITDSRGVKTSYFRNLAGDVTRVQQWNNGSEQVTDYTYNLLGRLTGIRDALGEETQISYDALGRRIRLVDPNVGAYDYVYSDGGRLIEEWGPGGSIATFRYDRTGNMLSKEFSDGSRQEFSYNPAGDLIQITDAAGVLNLEYDMRGRIISRQRQVDGETYQTRYAYDSLDRITGITYPDGFEIHNRYGSGGNLLEVVDGQNAVLATGMAYNAAGQLLEIRYGNGVTSRMAYDDLLRMTTNDTRSEVQGTIQDLDYSYDPNGNILSIVDQAFGSSQYYEYDDLGRLVKATGNYGVETYEYDAIGNLLRKGSMVFGFDPQHPQRVICGVDTSLFKGRAEGIGNNPYASPCENIPEASSVVAGKNTISEGSTAGNPNLARSFEIVYDENGNAVEKGGTQYEYDPENHLVRVRDAKGKLVAENTYDAAGQRILQVTPQGKHVYIDGIYEVSRTHVSRHVYAGPLLIASVVQPRAMTPASKGVTPNGLNALAGMVGLVGLLIWLPFLLNGRKRWLAGLGASNEIFRRHPYRSIVLILILNALICAVAAPQYDAQASVALKGAGKTYYYHSNHLGSVNAVTDEKGRVVERREYKPYGEPYQWTGPNSGPREFLITYQGQKFDDATGLYYMGARHYDPETGRFLAADAVVSDPSNPSTLNRYAFAHGNPIRFIDPTGHGCRDFVIAALIIVAVIALSMITAGLAAAAGIAAISVGGALGIVVGCAIVGGVGFGVYALATGVQWGSTEFWEYVAAGAVLGATIGGAISVATAMAAITGAGFSSGLCIIFAKITGAAVIGAATGAVTFIGQYAILSALNKDPGSLLGDAFFEAIGWGAAFGVLFGLLSLGVASGAARWAAQSPMKVYFAQVKGWTRAWKLSPWLSSSYRWYATSNFLNEWMLAPGIGWGSALSPGAAYAFTLALGERHSMGSGAWAALTQYAFSPLGSWAYALWTHPFAP